MDLTVVMIHPWVLADLQILSTAGRKLRGECHASAMTSEQSENFPFPYRRFRLSDEQDVRAFTERVMCLPGVLAVFRGTEWRTNATCLQEATVTCQRQCEAFDTRRRQKFTEYWRSVEETELRDMQTYGMMTEIVEHLSQGHINILRGFRRCEVQSWLVIVDRMMGFVDFDHRLHWASSGRDAIGLLMRDLCEDLRGPLPPSPEAFEKIPFDLELRQKDGRKCARLEISRSSADVCRGSLGFVYQFFLRENTGKEN